MVNPEIQKCIDDLKQKLREIRSPEASESKSVTVSGYYDNWPIAGNFVDGRRVIEDVPNIPSISATLNNYTVLKGIREVPIELFNSSLSNLFYAKRDFDIARHLADEISYSRQIAPLIVVVDEKGPYILEGAHRLGALGILRAKSFPALVVIDEDSDI